jgi:hypothetical protein
MDAISLTDPRLTASERHLLRQIVYRLEHQPRSSLPASYTAELDRVFGVQPTQEEHRG